MKRIVSLVLSVVMVLGVFVATSENGTAKNNVNVVVKAANSTTPHLTGISNASSGLYIKWNAVSDSVGYRVYRSGAGENYWTYLGTTKSLYYTDTKTVSGNYYRYTVRSVVNGRYSDFENGLYLKRLSDPGSIKTANNVFGVKVTWNKVAGATGYRVYRRTAGESSWKYLGAVNTNNFIDSSANSNTYYKYTVRATSGNTYSYFNAGSLIKFVATPQLTNLLGSTNSVKVQWFGVYGATGYRVYRRGAGESWKLLATVTGTSYVDTKVVKNKYYKYTVRAVSGGYISDFEQGLLIKFVGENESVGNSIVLPTIPATETLFTLTTDDGIDDGGWVEDKGTTKPAITTQTNDNLGFSEFEVNSNGVLTKYNGSDSFVTIPRKINGVNVTAIGDACFANSGIKSVYIHAGITSIGVRAFENCAYLGTVSFVDTKAKVTIGDFAFRNCPSLSSVHLPAVKVGMSAFGNCTALSSVIFASGSEKIGAYCFTNCKALSSVTIPESVAAEGLGQDIFNGCDYGKLTIITPDGSDAQTYAQDKNIMTRVP